MTNGKEAEKREFPATVVHLFGNRRDFRAVINRGSANGIHVGDRLVVYGEGPEIVDLESGAPLGTLELFRGTAEVVHVQGNMATIESDMYKEAEEERNLIASFKTKIRRVHQPFRDISKSDKVRRI